MKKYDNLTKFSSDAEYNAAKEQLPYPQVSLSGTKVNYDAHYPADGKLAVLKQDRVNWTDDDIDFLQNNIARFDSNFRIENLDAIKETYDEFEALPDKNDISRLFKGSKYRVVTVFPKIDTSNTTIMSINTGESIINVFKDFGHLKTIPYLDTSKITNMEGLFMNLRNVKTIPLLNTSNVTNMQGMFNNCTQLTSIPKLDTSNVTAMDYMFGQCSNLTSIPKLDTSNVTSMQGMFMWSRKLTTIPKLDTSKVTIMDNPHGAFMFALCIGLTTLGGFTGLKVNLKLSDCPLTRQSILNVFNEAADVKSSPQTLTLGQVNLDKLTPEDKKIATDKGWILA